MMLSDILKQNNFLAILVLLIPLSLIFGNIVNIILISLSIIYIFLLITKKIELILNLNHYLVLLFFLYIILNSSFKFFNQTIDIENYIKSILYLRYFLLYLVIDYLIINNAFFLKNLKYSIILPLSFVSLDTIIQFFYGVDLFGIEASADRLTGPFFNEHIPGSYMAKFFLILIFFLIINNFQSNLQKKYNLVINSILIIAIFFSIVITGERTAFIEVLLAIFLIAIFYQYSLKKKFIILSLFTLVIISILSSYPKLKERYIDQNLIFFGIETKYSKNNEEVGMDEYNNFLDTDWGQHYLTAYAIWVKNPLFGTGYDTFSKVCNKSEFEIYGERRCSTHPHHYYLEILSEQGIIGFILFINILILSIFIFRQNINYFTMIVLFSIIIFYFPIKPTGSFFNTWIASIFWFTFSLLGLKNDKYFE